MKITIKGLNSGSYYLVKDKLSFNYLKFKVENTRYNSCEFEIDKQSALEIVHTLLNSLDMLDKDTEDLICRMQERIDKQCQ